jgi:hypothetical protein
MPAWVENHDVWEKAKTAALKTYREEDKSFWPVVASLYQKMGGKVKSDTKATLQGTALEYERAIKATEALPSDERAGLDAVAESIVKAENTTTAKEEPMQELNIIRAFDPRMSR